MAYNVLYDIYDVRLSFLFFWLQMESNAFW